MRYYLRGSSLIIRGRFRACSSGHGGGIRDCTTLINHQVAHHFSGDPAKEIENLARSLGFSAGSTLTLLTAVSIQNLCILSWDNIFLFVTAGVTHPDPEFSDEVIAEPSAGTINIILVTREGLLDQALVDAVITVTEAKTLALKRSGYSFAGTVTDAVMTASEGPGSIRYVGSATEIGRKIHESVVFGVREALLRQSGEVKRERPSFFIRSSLGGEHWIEWKKEQCPYYPCHFPGQRCDFCYCPLYPCGDTLLGDWISKPGRPAVWACTRCTLNHEPSVVRHLLRNPEASLNELKAVSQMQHW